MLLFSVIYIYIHAQIDWFFKVTFSALGHKNLCKLFIITSYFFGKTLTKPDIIRLVRL